MKYRINIIDYFNSEARYLNQWDTVVSELLKEHGYEVNVIRNTRINMSSLYDTITKDLIYKSRIIEEIFNDYHINQLNKNEIFIFADAWNPVIVFLRFLNAMYNLNWKFIGVWISSLTDTYSHLKMSLYRRYKSWAFSWERALYQSYDVNCFITDKARKRFSTKYAMSSVRTSAYITGLPFDGIRKIRDEYPRVKKENIIIIPFEFTSDVQSDVIRAYQEDYPNYTFIHCAEYNLLDYEYYELLNRAKIVMSISLAESNPASIYIGMVFGCIPIVPTRLVYDDILPKKYQYPIEYVKPPMLNIIRGREFMHNLIDTAIEQYDILVDEMYNDLQVIEDKHFNSNKFLKLLKEITDGFE